MEGKARQLALPIADVSNPVVECLHPGLLRSAMTRPARNDGRTIVIARREVAKQSRWGRLSLWIASLRSQ
ncbi:MAG: hypothetical protein LBT00_12850 [Spirochaetaceae bacterium]|nr:hypothetical protein [Spirochaetaceae bacterium]